jgi:uncharacterized protein (TIGR00369 family)
VPPPRTTGLVELLGLTETAPEPGVVRCELALDDRHRNIQGVTHGSVPIALLDTAMGHALSGVLAPDEFCSTTQLSVQFLRATRSGDRLVATGKVTRRGRRIAYLEGSCVDGTGAEVARAHGTWYVGTVR